MWISRHGTANDDDELIFNDFPCGETVSFHYIQDTDKCFKSIKYINCVLQCNVQILFQTNDYVCKDEHIDSHGVNQDARVCHCFEDKCNKEVPTPDPTATPDPGPGPGPGPATTCQTTCTTTCSNSASAFHP